MHRGCDLSTVVWATTLGSVLGPNLTGPGAIVAGWLHVPAKAGPFVFSFVGLLVTALVVSTRLRPDPLLPLRAAALATAPEDENAGASVLAVGVLGVAMAAARLTSTNARVIHA